MCERARTQLRPDPTTLTAPELLVTFDPHSSLRRRRCARSAIPANLYWVLEAGVLVVSAWTRLNKPLCCELQCAVVCAQGTCEL